MLDPGEVEEKTASVISLFEGLELSPVKYLLSFFPLPARHEIDVYPAELIVRMKNREVDICWPKLGFDHINMEAMPVTRETLFIKNKYEILEPLDGELINPLLVDIIFVPLIAFDLRGYRVGFGKGYYDRYLARCRPDAIKIGFSFFEPIDLIDDIHEFDVPLNYCISPMRIYEF